MDASMAPSLRSLLGAALISPLLVASCAHDPSSSAPGADPAPCSYASANDGTQSYEILCRDPVANHVTVKHILLSWKDLANPDHPLDPRAADRTQASARELALELLAKVRGGAPIEPLMAQFSEDPGSAKTGQSYEVSPGAGLVSEFKSLSLRLQVGEAGIVQSAFGLHVIQRVP